MVRHRTRQQRNARCCSPRQIQRSDRRPRARAVRPSAAASSLVAAREMISASFGRRPVENQGRALVLVPNRTPSPAVDLNGRDELKERIRSALMARIDPSVAGRVPRDVLRLEVAKLVSEIATEE